eukprot:3739882-Prymnesium_polylepis.2
MTFIAFHKWGPTRYNVTMERTAEYLCEEVYEPDGKTLRSQGYAAVVEVRTASQASAVAALLRLPICAP